MYTGQHGEFMAFFVGGPANGMTQYLPRGRLEYRYFTPEVMDAFTNLGMATPHTEVGKIRYHLYLSTHEMRNPYYKGCYIFEWMGERG